MLPLPQSALRGHQIQRRQLSLAWGSLAVILLPLQLLVVIMVILMRRCCRPRILRQDSLV